jgi:virginiamycin B lyase
LTKRLSHRLNFLLAVLLLLTACGSTSTSSTSTTGNVPIDTPASGQHSGATAASMATGIFHEYDLPQTQSGLMRPAIDHKGRIWFGEMGHNYLAVFDPQTQTFQQMIPPRGADGIMGITVATDDSIWFAEQYANYIGHYNPDTQQYQVYNLPELTTPDPGDPHKTLTLPYAPNDITLDAHGNVWFTEMNADSLGMLNVRTGQFKHYALTAKKSVQTLDPYGIAVDPAGMIWFTEASTPRIGRLDPNTGDVRFFDTQTPGNPQMEIASDTYGTIWATSFTSGLLVRLDSKSATFTYYYAPHTGNAAGGLYGLTVTPAGTIWVTVSADNEIARLDVNANHFIYYQIPTAGSLPLGIVMGTHNTLWFTEASSDKIGVLQP